MPDTPLIILAAGGTGGHVFPAEALARELLGRGLRVALLTDRRGGKFGTERAVATAQAGAERAGYTNDLPIPIYKIRARSLGKGLLGKARSILEMSIGV